MPLPSRERPDVLMIAVDDLNHWIGTLRRNPAAKTPHIDRLASRGLAFTNAHCPAPVCNASRAALLSGKRPHETGVYDNGIDWERRIPAGTTVPAWFLRHGYEVRGAGKIFHSNTWKPAEWTDYQRNYPKGEAVDATESGTIGKLPYAKLRGGDDTLMDWKTATYGVEQLQTSRKDPLFLACGIYRPHLPWNVPGKYFDLHPLGSISLPPTIQNDLSDVPEAGKRMALGIGDHAAILENGGEMAWKRAMQAYLASISYADAQIGRILDALDSSPRRANTVVVLWGDHGWHLGEKEHWRKFTLWEEGTRTPYIWSVPGLVRPGSRCERPVDLMTLFPTLCDLCRMPLPSWIPDPSLRPLLANPRIPWRLPARTTFNQGNHTVRTDRWRYIRYADHSEELYDHRTDPYEWRNRAGDPGLKSVKAELSRWLPTREVPQPAKDLAL